MFVFIGKKKQFIYNWRLWSSVLCARVWLGIEVCRECVPWLLILVPAMLFCFTSGNYSSTDAKYIQDCLHYKHFIEVPIKCVGSRLWVRISAAMYNALADYERLSSAVLEICNDYAEDRNGEWRAPFCPPSLEVWICSCFIFAPFTQVTYLSLST